MFSGLTLLLYVDNRIMRRATMSIRPAVAESGTMTIAIPEECRHDRVDRPGRVSRCGPTPGKGMGLMSRRRRATRPEFVGASGPRVGLAAAGASPARNIGVEPGALRSGHSPQTCFAGFPETDPDESGIWPVATLNFASKSSVPRTAGLPSGSPPIAGKGGTSWSSPARIAARSRTGRVVRDDPTFAPGSAALSFEQHPQDPEGACDLWDDIEMLADSFNRHPNRKFGNDHQPTFMRNPTNEENPDLADDFVLRTLAVGGRTLDLIALDTPGSPDAHIVVKPRRARAAGRVQQAGEPRQMCGHGDHRPAFVKNRSDVPDTIGEA